MAFALVKVNWTVAFWAVVRVARNASAAQATFAALVVAELQSVVVVVLPGADTGSDKAQVWPPRVSAKLAVPEPDGVPLML